MGCSHEQHRHTQPRHQPVAQTSPDIEWIHRAAKGAGTGLSKCQGQGIFVELVSVAVPDIQYRHPVVGGW